jgi:hypothetical protein
VRWLVLLVLLATSARADMLVIEEPGIYYQCPTGKSWDEVTKCLKKHGRPEIVKSLSGAKLVRLDQQENGQWVDGGLYLYIEANKAWKVAGAWFGRGSDYELLDFKPLTVGKHTGHRIDIGQAQALWVQLDGVTAQQAVRRSSQTLFCGGVRNDCTTAMTNCEVLVRGGAFWTFRGVMKVNGNEVSIEGDRKNAGPFCTQAEKVFLGWPQI